MTSGGQVPGNQYTKLYKDWVLSFKMSGKLPESNKNLILRHYLSNGIQ